MKAPDEAAFTALRDGFRSGIPANWGEAKRSDAGRLIVIMAKLGGADLVGKSDALQAGTFWLLEQRIFTREIASHLSQ